MRTKTSSKLFWKIGNRLLNKLHKAISVPALRRSDGTWAKHASEKCDLLADTFVSKWSLPRPVYNSYSYLGFPPAIAMSTSVTIRTRNASQVLKALKTSSGTGPDLLGATILKMCSKTLGVPFAKLARSIVMTSQWPDFLETSLDSPVI